MSSNTLILHVMGTDSFSAAKLTANTVNKCLEYQKISDAALYRIINVYSLSYLNELYLEVNIEN